MKKYLLFFSIFLTVQITAAQPPEYFVDNWYLHSFSFNGEEVFIETLGLTEGPAITFQNDYTLQGNSFCNDFTGTFEYRSNAPLGIHDNFRAHDIIRGFENCEDLENMENHYFTPLVGEMLSDITAGPLPDGYFLVLQFDSFGYHYYRNYPPLEVPENKLQNIIFYPNPAGDKIFIKTPINKLSILITDINGRTVISHENPNSNEIDVSSLKPGMYFLNIQSSEGNITKKFIKN